MSRIRDELYFSPELRFADLDRTGKHLPSQLQKRIDGFYLNPAISLAKGGHAFASGVLVVCAMDALVLLMTGTSSSQARIMGFCLKIPELATADTPNLFCKHFRNGLVHSARVKEGSEFSLDIQHVAVSRNDRLIVNPLKLALSVQAVLSDYIARLKQDPAAKQALRKKLLRHFAYELNH